MNDVTMIDRSFDTFPRYFDSGFGVLQGEAAGRSAASGASGAAQKMIGSDLRPTCFAARR